MCCAMVKEKLKKARNFVGFFLNTLNGEIMFPVVVGDWHLVKLKVCLVKNRFPFLEKNLQADN